MEQVKNPTKIQLDVEKSKSKKETEKINFEMEENIHSYLIFLLAVKQEDYDVLSRNKKCLQVLGVILATQTIQYFAMAVMIVDMMP